MSTPQSTRPAMLPPPARSAIPAASTSRQLWRCPKAARPESDNRDRRRVTIDRAIVRLMVLDGVLVDRTGKPLPQKVVQVLVRRTSPVAVEK